MPAPTELTDVLTGSTAATGAPVRLGPWDVRVFTAD
ncbi:hypothetical protein FHR34_007803 [Kitasatospora kifunensis]|uniref:Beta-galactosidase C-terminal domain-containing protein n=1 Tax=Kitasatospora kifunensis TaxID=58351 RepID=A0A7W7RC65_KITKI|nr:Beta-galactosidase C-terminal domain [Kitasatospora kifunensis]MBB4928706.1 hypothetical protein [Kitasatospora kifunensis]